MAGNNIEFVLKKHTNQLMSIPGVVGTAVSLCGGEPCIKVMVEKKAPEVLNRIPQVLEGFPVVIEETGKIRALDR